MDLTWIAAHTYGVSHFNPALHPRRPPGTPHAGEFTGRERPESPDPLPGQEPLFTEPPIGAGNPAGTEPDTGDRPVTEADVADRGATRIQRCYYPDKDIGGGLRSGRSWSIDLEGSAKGLAIIGSYYDDYDDEGHGPPTSWYWEADARPIEGDQDHPELSVRGEAPTLAEAHDRAEAALRGYSLEVRSTIVPDPVLPKKGWQPDPATGDFVWMDGTEPVSTPNREPQSPQQRL